MRTSQTSYSLNQSVTGLDWSHSNNMCREIYLTAMTRVCNYAMCYKRWGYPHALVIAIHCSMSSFVLVAAVILAAVAAVFVVGRCGRQSLCSWSWSSSSRLPLCCGGGGGGGCSHVVVVIIIIVVVDAVLSSWWSLPWWWWSLWSSLWSSSPQLPCGGRGYRSCGCSRVVAITAGDVLIF